jgi:hypothetical protein
MRMMIMIMMISQLGLWAPSPGVQDVVKANNSYIVKARAL